MHYGELSTQDFWSRAFSKDAPFYESYVKYFSRGVLEESPDILDIHREAIYYLTDDALSYILPRIIHIARKYPDHGFVESLAFFISRDDQRARLIRAIQHINNEAIDFVVSDIDSLSVSLSKSQDDDLSSQILTFRPLLLAYRRNPSSPHSSK